MIYNCMSFKIGNLNQSRIKVESCIVAIKQWMLDNMLKLNHDKTEFLIVIGNWSRICKFDIQVGNHMIQSSLNAYNLGVIFDSHLDMHTHITSMCWSAMYHLWRISSIRQFLDRGATETLIHAFISSRLDYCNLLLTGLPSCELDRLERVQNVASNCSRIQYWHTHNSAVNWNCYVCQCVYDLNTVTVAFTW